MIPDDANKAECVRELGGMLCPKCGELHPPQPRHWRGYCGCGSSLRSTGSIWFSSDMLVLL